MPTLAEDGYEVRRGNLAGSALDRFEAALTALYAMQAEKIGYLNPREVCLQDLYAGMEDNDDEEALYEVQKLIPALPECVSFAAFARRLVDYPLALIEGPALFINRPGSDRLAYRWHTEAHYYPKRRRFLNLWWPLFGDRDATNGAMSVKPGSHLRAWDFAEYQEGPHHFVQYEVPECLHADLPEVTIEAARGDLVIFDRNLLHRSNPNTSDAIAFAGVARVWDPSADLTLSGTMAATPYGGDVGRAGMVVPC